MERCIICGKRATAKIHLPNGQEMYFCKTDYQSVVALIKRQIEVVDVSGMSESEKRATMAAAKKEGARKKKRGKKHKQPQVETTHHQCQSRRDMMVLMNAEAQEHGCDAMTTWFARNQADYSRGIELGMISGWPSWEMYEAACHEWIAAMDAPVWVLDMSPDEVLAQLEERDLPNTTLGRSHLYSLRAAEDRQIT